MRSLTKHTKKILLIQNVFLFLPKSGVYIITIIKVIIIYFDIYFSKYFDQYFDIWYNLL